MNRETPAIPKAVFFDLDDTLFDHRYAAHCALKDLQERHPDLRKYPLEFLSREDFRLLGEKQTLVLAGILSVAESRIQRMQGLFASCGIWINSDEAKHFADHRQTIYRKMRRAVPGANPLLQMLKGRVQIGIVTNNFTAEQKDKLDACGLTEFIDVLVTSERRDTPSRIPRIFEMALEQAHCSALEAVMIGDSWEMDIVGANNAGIRSIWFNREGEVQAAHPSVVEITSLEPADLIARQIFGNCENWKLFFRSDAILSRIDEGARNHTPGSNVIAARSAHQSSFIKPVK
jgi:HAD superfamily hydrolase (TIGR01549 family)